MQKSNDKKNPHEDVLKETNKEFLLKPWSDDQIKFLKDQEDLLIM